MAFSCKNAGGCPTKASRGLPPILAPTVADPDVVVRGSPWTRSTRFNSISTQQRWQS